MLCESRRDAHLSYATDSAILTHQNNSTGLVLHSHQQDCGYFEPSKIFSFQDFLFLQGQVYIEKPLATFQISENDFISQDSAGGKFVTEFL